MRGIATYICIMMCALGLHAQNSTPSLYSTKFLDTSSRTVSADIIRQGRYAVVFFLSEECTICQYYTSSIKTLTKQYESDSIRFYGIFPQRFSTPAAIKDWQQTYSIPIHLYADTSRAFTRALKATITPQVVVFNTVTGAIVYSGRIDNGYVRIGRERTVVTQHELNDVLQSITKYLPVTTPTAAPIGCYISFK